ncbi:TPA: pyridoxal phosphate-dependent aminotransferase, partial [bacterium]|nr:pyridoxal phosphate-dependent aminotransferase [bacterium]
WPDYDMIIAINGWKQIRYPLLKDKGFLPDMKALRSLITDKSKILVINSPSNPTGAVFPRSIQQEMVEIASEYDLYLMSDETYDQIIFDGEHVSPAIYDKEGRVLSIFSFSKVYAMTGWRVGYVCASPSLSRLIADIQEPYVSCACTVSQKAAESALTGPQDCQKTMVDAYRRRRDIAVEILKENDMVVYSPQGAIYMLIDISQSGMSSHEFAMSLLEKERVAVSPGDTFGEMGKDYIRICFAVSEDNLEEALKRICRHVRRNA